MAVFRLTTFFLAAGLVFAQDYSDYAGDYVQDNIYHDYAKRQAEKEGGGGG